jgi:hypothetical protein
LIAIDKLLPGGSITTPDLLDQQSLGLRGRHARKQS